MRFLVFALFCFSTAASYAGSSVIEKKCLSSTAKKFGPKTRKKICACVLNNLEYKLDPESITKLEKIYKDRHSRIAASKDDVLKPLVELDFEVSRQCLQNSQWKLPVEDLGSPDPL